MQKVVVIDVVGLSAALIGKHTPFLSKYVQDKKVQAIMPMLPAVTTSVQSTYLTGKLPAEHGIVGNGWYDRRDGEIKFWKQSNKLVEGEKIWEKAKKVKPDFTTSKMFWWYNMYATADYSATPRPNYLADGRKMPDCYTHPASLRDELQDKFGKFPLFSFWGPNANIASTQWIANATIYTDKKYDADLTLVYLPHLDYCLQKYGPDAPEIGTHLQEVDKVIQQLVEHFEQQQTKIIILSEYGIGPVNDPIHINRVLRRNNLLAIRTERGLELLDAGASKAFAVADHQIAHIYINDDSVYEDVFALLKNTKGIAEVWDKAEQKTQGVNHERSGDFVVMADPESWFTYYFWLEDKVAPDYARMVDIHKKPGYDPIELYMSSKLRAGYKLLRKKAGFRYTMDVIPLNAELLKGSHGATNVSSKYYPVIITDDGFASDKIVATDVHDIIWKALQL